MRRLLQWISAGALAGAGCAIIDALAHDPGVTALAPLVGRFATCGAVMGMAAVILDGLVARFFRRRRAARVSVVISATMLTVLLVAIGLHRRDGGPLAPLWFMMTAAAVVGFTAALLPNPTRTTWRALAGLAAAGVAGVCMTMDPAGLRGTYPSLDLTLTGAAFAAAMVGIGPTLSSKPLLSALLCLLVLLTPRVVSEDYDVTATLTARSARFQVVERTLVWSGLWPPRQLDETVDEPDPETLFRSPRDRVDTGRRLAALRGADAAPMNILWVTIDALRGDVVAQGGADSLTPNLDRLAVQGCDFPDAWSQSNATAGSMSSFLSGRYPSRTPMASGWRTGEVAFESPSMAQLLGDAGFRTGWFTGLNPTTLAAPVMGRLERGFDHVVKEADSPDAQRTVQQALAWMTGEDRRFFAWVHLFDPHAPYVSWEDEPGASPRTRWESEVRHADGAVGTLLRALEREGLADDTIVVAHADHGEAFNEHGRYFHATTFFQTQIHVPLIIRVPGIPAATLPGPASNIDIPPTLLHALDMPAEPAHQGHSLLPRLLEPELRWPRLAVAETLVVDPRVPWAEERIRTITDGTYKLIEYLDGPARLLFELGTDPGEQQNLASAHPEVVSRLRGWVAALDRRFDGARSKPPKAHVLEQLRRRLTSPDEKTRTAAFLELRQDPSSLAEVEDLVGGQDPATAHTVLTLIESFVCAHLDGDGRPVPLGDEPSAVRLRLIERLGRSPRFWNAPLPEQPANMTEAESHAWDLARAARGDREAMAEVNAMIPAATHGWAQVLPTLARGGAPGVGSLARQLNATETPPDLLMRVLNGLSHGDPDQFIEYVVDRWPDPHRQLGPRHLRTVINLTLRLDEPAAARALLALYADAEPDMKRRIEERLKTFDATWTRDEVQARSRSWTQQRFETAHNKSGPEADSLRVVGAGNIPADDRRKVRGPTTLTLQNTGDWPITMGPGGTAHLRLNWGQGSREVPAAHVSLPRAVLPPGESRSVTVLMQYPKRRGRWELSPVSDPVTYEVTTGDRRQGPSIAARARARLPVRGLDSTTLFEVPLGGDVLWLEMEPAKGALEVSVDWDLPAHVPAFLCVAEGGRTALSRDAAGRWTGRITPGSATALGLAVDQGPRLIHVGEILIKQP